MKKLILISVLGLTACNPSPDRVAYMQGQQVNQVIAQQRQAPIPLHDFYTERDNQIRFIIDDNVIETIIKDNQNGY